MITREHFVRLRTHGNNIQRYRGLLETSLTDFERRFIEKRLSEEQLAVENLAARIAAPLNTQLHPQGA
jgi:hypothetical protein